LRVRRAKVGDIPAMMNLESLSPAAAHWPRQQYEGFFAPTSSQTPTERLVWVVEDESGDWSEKSAGEECEILGFLVAHQVDAEWELENIVVAETARRRGLGTLLLQALIAQVSAKQGKSIFLEVRESNRSARALYQKVGFEEEGLRKSYYASPPEDAILCRLSLF
jgi:[ribosomal protein S18]-alanine N-acetyltransferase